jgi:hypothetical protein
MTTRQVFQNPWSRCAFVPAQIIDSSLQLICKDRADVLAELGHAAWCRCHVPEFIKAANELTASHIN